MCGIAGISYLFPREAKSTPLKSMLKQISHRGPDGQGFLGINPISTSINNHYQISDHPIQGNFSTYFGHRRLSIIDLAGSRQPLPNEDNSIWITFNGEIYNYLEIRNHLELKGHTLREKGDTEVLVHLWEEYGPKMLDQLQGMFAFAIYDSKQDLLFLARDRFGEKPLYFWEAGSAFLFCSELQGFFEVEDFNKLKYNNIAIKEYFRHGYIPSPMTIYKGISSLPAAHYMLVKKNKVLKIEKYWTPQVSSLRSTSVEEVEVKLNEAVRKCLIADVPVGIFLSGGLDSSLTTALASKMAGKKLKTFNLSTGNNIQDESLAAKEIAAFLGTEHHVFEARPDFIEISEKLAPHYGQPFADYSLIPTFLISKEASVFVKVVLSGDGGDELFGGYSRYLNNSFSEILSYFPLNARRKSFNILEKLLPKSLHLAKYRDFIISSCPTKMKGENRSPMFHEDWLNQVFKEQNLTTSPGTFLDLFEKTTIGTPVEKWMSVDQRHYLPDDILVKVDIASMSNSIECRTPYLNHQFAEFANSIDIKQKIQGRINKVLLRDLAKKKLPPHIANLPKKGFSLPLANWMRGDLKKWCEDKIFGSEEFLSEYIHFSPIRKMWNQHQQSIADHSMRLWIIIALVNWKDSMSKLNQNQHFSRENLG